MGKLNPSDIVYLDVEHVLDLYADEFGYATSEEARLRRRSPSALEGALARPIWYAQLRDADLARIIHRSLESGQGGTRGIGRDD